MKDAFNFILKTLLVIKIFKFLSCLFGYVEKTARSERLGLFQNSDVTVFLNKQLQYTYCSISHE